MMKSLKLNVDGEVVNPELQQVQLLLPGSGKIVVNGNSVLHEPGNSRQVNFTAVIRPRTLSQPFMLEAFNCKNGEGISLELIVAIVKKLKEIIKSPYFELEEWRCV